MEEKNMAQNVWRVRFAIPGLSGVREEEVQGLTAQEAIKVIAMKYGVDYYKVQVFSTTLIRS